MRYFFLLLLLTGHTLLMAQTNRSPRGLDDLSNKKNPTSDNVKKTSEEEEDSEKKTSDASYNNTITFSYGHLLRGIAVFTYERNFTERFGLGASLGYCFVTDQALSMFGSDDFDMPRSDYFTLQDYLNMERLKHGYNYYVDLTGKINSNTNFVNLMGSELEYRFFAALSVRRYLNQIDLEDNLSTKINAPVNMTHTGALVKLGQTVYRLNGLTNEYYIGFGTLRTKFPTMLKYYPNGTTITELQYQHKNNFLIVLGGQIGFSF
jgi:hypothetical protein